MLCLSHLKKKEVKTIKNKTKKWLKKKCNEGYGRQSEFCWKNYRFLPKISSRVHIYKMLQLFRSLARTHLFGSFYILLFF